MTPFSPEELNELAAGYVLGDLNSAESALFQQQLQQDATLQIRVAQLQKTLAMMALGIPSQETPPSLRSRIMQTVESPTPLSSAPLQPDWDQAASSPPVIPNQNEKTQPHPQSSEWATSPQQYFGRGYRWILWGAGAALIAIALGTQQYQLKQQIAMLETALSQQQSWSAAIPERDILLPAETTLTLEAPAELVTQQWPGLQHLSQDHQQSHIQDPRSGNVNLQTNQQAVPQKLLDRLMPSSTMPRLVEKSRNVEAQFLTITPCKMGKIQGLRMTYLLDPKTTVSVYKLYPGEELPHPGAEAMSLQSAEGLSMVLWEEDTFLYAIVSDLPINRLKKFTINS